MKKILFSILFSVITLNNFSQSGTSSPYSFYGIGTSTFKGSIDSRSMGGLSVYSDSIHVNLTNPASLSELKRVNYSLGITYDDLTFKSENANEYSNSSNVNYLAVAIPTKHFTFAFGVIPQTSVGYLLESKNESVVPNSIDRYKGEGGVNTAFLSFGVKLFKKISVGLTTNYEFGNLNHITTRFLENVELATRLESNSSLSGLNNVYSLMLREKITNKLSLHATFVSSQKFDLGSNNSQTISAYSVTGQFGGETIPVDLGYLEKTEITVPKYQTFGLGLGVDTKWFVGAEYKLVDGGGLNNKLFELDNVEFKKGSKFSLGGFYIPKYDSFTSFFSRIVYRGGFRVEDSGLHIDNQSIKEVGLNFGFGIPFQGFSSINLGFEVGKRGTTNAGLIQENFFSVRLGMSLSDLWFVKNKYN
ncbi:outer membrane protein transport protein [Flavobacteriaceae bacterium]|nr:outer membrane protein transport protein [Flavobacteriaceae bacterium]